MSVLKLLRTDPTLRLIALALALMGALNASVFPYQSLIAIERIGLSEGALSLVLVLAAVVAVTSSLLFGFWGDQYGHRRLLGLTSAFAGTVGLALMIFHPAPLTLVVTHGILLPMALSLYGQLFALLRLTSPLEGEAREVIQQNTRSAMSAGFLLMLVFWTLTFRFGVDLMRVYLSAGIASLILSLLLFVRWPADATLTRDRRSGLNLVASFRAITRPHILSRLLLLGAVMAVNSLYMVVTSLIFDAAPGRGPGDVALYFGLVAGFEVPAMLLLPGLVAHLPRPRVLAWGTVVYALALAALPFLVDTPAVWLLCIAAGTGGAAFFTLPIGYFQDLMEGRPGTAGAMLAVQKLCADTLGAGIFYLGTTLGSYTTAAMIGGAFSVAAALTLIVADHHAWLMPRPSDSSSPPI